MWKEFDFFLKCMEKWSFRKHGMEKEDGPRPETTKPHKNKDPFDSVQTLLPLSEREKNGRNLFCLFSIFF